MQVGENPIVEVTTALLGRSQPDPGLGPRPAPGDDLMTAASDLIGQSVVESGTEPRSTQCHPGSTSDPSASRRQPLTSQEPGQPLSGGDDLTPGVGRAGADERRHLRVLGSRSAGCRADGHLVRRGRRARRPMVEGVDALHALRHGRAEKVQIDINHALAAIHHRPGIRIAPRKLHQHFRNLRKFATGCARALHGILHVHLICAERSEHHHKLSDNSGYLKVTAFSQLDEHVQSVFWQDGPDVPEITDDTAWPGLPFAPP